MAIVTGKFRASYANVFEPRANQNGGEAKYSITMLIPKTDVATLNRIYAEIENARQEGLSKTFGGKMPPQLSMSIHDGDGVKPTSGEPYGEECRGCMVINASSKTKPSVVDVNLQPILNQSEFYSGCYARASINFFAYNSNGNRGIGCGLNNVQKLEDGEPLSGRTSAEEDFGGSNSFQPAAYQAPGQPYQPYQQPAQAQYQQSAVPQYQQPVPQYQAPVQQPAVPQYQQPVPQYQPPVQYQQPAVPAYAPQPPYQQSAQQFNPITGAPIGVMGI